MWLDCVIFAFKSDSYFNVYFVVQFLLVFLITFVKSIGPTSFLDYGKTYTPGTSRLGKDVNGQLAFYLSHIMTPIVFLYTYRKLKGNVWALPCVLFMIQMGYRVGVYPFFRRISWQNVCPLESVLFRFFVSINFGFSIGRLLALHPRRMGPIFKLLVLALYVPVTIALYVHDFWICRQRKESHEGYVIMHKGLFRRFTCAQYTLQGLQWLIFSYLCIDSFLGVWSYLVWLCITLLDRATICHQYFRQIWPRYDLLHKYPMIPVRVSTPDDKKAK